MLSNRFLFLLIFLLASLWIVGLMYGGGSKGEAQGSSFGKGAAGTSIFREYLERVNPAGVRIVKKALLSEDDLDDARMYVLFSPKRSVTTREADFLRRFVDTGGELLLSAHSEETLKNIVPVLMQFTHEDLQSMGTKPFPPFKNRQYTTVHHKGSQLFYESGKSYAFYSNLQFTKECSHVQVSCFYKTFYLGKGKVYFWLGLSPLSNGLIGLEENRSIALDPGMISGKVLFDEYHHFFTEKSMIDLISAPAFFLPLVGLALVGVTYLLFGYSGFHQYEPPREGTPPDLHDIAVGMITASVRKRGYRGDAIEEYRRILYELYPEHRKVIDAQILGGDRGKSHQWSDVKRLLRWHYEHVSRKGV